MLVLSRRLGEEIMIGDAKVRVLGFKGEQVSLGIDAPLSTRVFRTELFKKMEENGETEIKPGHNK